MKTILTVSIRIKDDENDIQIKRLVVRDDNEESTNVAWWLGHEITYAIEAVMMDVAGSDDIFNAIERQHEDKKDDSQEEDKEKAR